MKNNLISPLSIMKAKRRLLPLSYQLYYKILLERIEILEKYTDMLDETTNECLNFVIQSNPSTLSRSLESLLI